MYCQDDTGKNQNAITESTLHFALVSPITQRMTAKVEKRK